MIHVAVIARPRSTTLAACLDALRAAGAVAPTVVEVGRDGPAQARNAALGGCPQAVLALVEDDVLVAPGWLAAVAGAWGDPRVAVAGGPLEGTPAVAGPAATYPGANVAFRAAALRGAGGFWPARGDPDERDWFSEEHEAQRELGRIGWGTTFVPGMRARRIGPAPSPAQRLRRGARRQAVGEALSRPAAARGLVRALGGVVLGDRRERLGRAAESLGGLVGERLVRRELAPVVASTPFRPSVPQPPRGGVRRLRRRGERAAPTVLLYHRIATDDQDPLALAVSPEHFAEHLDVLRGREVVGLEAVAAGAAPPHAVALTFDDGYANNLVLREAGLPATLFVCTGPVEQGRPFWWDGVWAACRRRTGDLVEIGDRAFVLGTVASGHLLAWLVSLGPAEVEAALEVLAPPPTDRALTVEELRDLAQHVTIGAHSRSHRSLGHAGPHEQREEIERSRDDLTAWLGTAPTAFAYPFGVPGEAFTPTTQRLVREAGFTCAVQSRPGSMADRYALPRVAVPDVDGETFARMLDARAWG